MSRTQDELRAAWTVQIALSSVSLVAAVLPIVTFLCFSKLKRRLFLLAVTMSAVDLFNQMLLLLFGPRFQELAAPPTVPSDACLSQAFFRMVYALYSTNLSTLIAVTLWSIMVNRSLAKYWAVGILGGVVAAVTPTLVAQFTHVIGYDETQCWIESRFPLAQLLIFYCPLWISILLGVWFWIEACLMFRQIGRLDQPTLYTRLRWYPIVNAAIWVIPTVHFIVEAVSGQSSPFWLLVLQQVPISSHGLLNAAVFMTRPEVKEFFCTSQQNNTV